MMPTSTDRTTVFVSHSHKDRKYLERLQVHLTALACKGTIDLWNDTKITPGANWCKEVKSAIEAAAVAVLLVSADF